MASDGSCVSTPASPPRHALHSSLRALIANANLSPTSPHYGKISSPMSCLALNLSGLSTECVVATPRRRLSLSSVDTPDGQTSSTALLDDGTFTESPGVTHSPTVEMSLSKLAKEYNRGRPSSYGRSRSLPFRKMQTLPIPAFRLSPVDFDDLSSDDDNASDDHLAYNTKPDMQLSHKLDSSYCSEESFTTDEENMCTDDTTECTSVSAVFGMQREEMMNEAITDSVSRSLDFNISDDLLECSLKLSDTSVQLDDSDSQGIVADFDDSFTCSDYKQPRRHSTNTYSRHATLSDHSLTTSDLDGSFVSPVFTDASSSSGKSNSPDFNPTGTLSDDGSQDSGVSMDKERDDHVFLFPVPVSTAPRRVRFISEDTCSPLKYSPIKSPSSPYTHASPLFFNSFSSSHLSMLAKSPSECSPVSLKTSPLTGISPPVCDRICDGGGDGFAIDQEVEEITTDSCLPHSFSNLFSAPLLNNGTHNICDPADLHKKTRVCRKLLDRSLSVQESRSRSQKRASPMHEGQTTPQCKRRRSSLATDSANLSSTHHVPRPKACLKRCSSESEAIIKSVLNKVTENANLVGDGSKPYLLPVTQGRHADLKSITPDVLSEVLTQDIDQIDRCMVIDCRYPYEYSGGHIRGSHNLYQKQHIVDELLTEPIQTRHPQRRVLIVFHCEFSAERAPTLSRFLRNRDRDTNKDNYPELYYPELYLLDGGYKAFYEQHPELCDPCSYTPMLHDDHRDELRRMRVKSRSWAEDKARTSMRLKF